MSQWDERELAPLVEAVRSRLALVTRDEVRSTVVVVLSELRGLTAGGEGHHSHVRAERLAKLDRILSAAWTIDTEMEDPA